MTHDELKKKALSDLEVKKHYQQIMNIWFDVNLLLPNDQEVVVVIRDDYLPALAYYKQEDNTFREISMRNAYRLVTHWCPLPELPK